DRASLRNLNTGREQQEAGNTNGKRQRDHGRARRRLTLRRSDKLFDWIDWKVHSPQIRRTVHACFIERKHWKLIVAHGTSSSAVTTEEGNNNNSAKFRLGQSQAREWMLQK